MLASVCKWGTVSAASSGKLCTAVMEFSSCKISDVEEITEAAIMPGIEGTTFLANRVLVA